MVLDCGASLLAGYSRPVGTGALGKVDKNMPVAIVLVHASLQRSTGSLAVFEVRHA